MCIILISNQQHIEQRHISFEEVVAALENRQLLDIIEHHNPSKYPNQKVSYQELPLLTLRDKLQDELRQAAALATVATGQNFLGCEPYTLRYC